MNNKTPASWRGRHRKLRIALPVLLLTLAAFALFFGLSRPAAPAPPPPTVVVERGDIAQTVQAGGIVQPKRRVDVGAQTSGLVRRLHVKLGDWVKAGDLLVSLDPATARTAVQQAEAMLAQQKASYRRAQVALNAARREAERESRLLAGDATTTVAAEQAATRLADLEADVQGQQAAMAQREADLADKRLQLDRVQVHAPMDGQVVNLAVQEGQSVNAAMASPVLLTLAQMRTVTVKARVPEADIGQLRAGQVARLTTLAAGSRRHEGRVHLVQPLPERLGSALYYNVLFDVDNAQAELLSDMTVRVELVVAEVRDVPVLPVAALGARAGEGRFIAQAVNAAGQVQARTVRTGVRDATRVQVVEGLQVGERVQMAALAAPLPMSLPPLPGL